MGKDKKGGNMSKIAGDINAEMMKKAIHDSRAKLFAEIVGKTGSQQSVIDCAVQEIESLRQQLADMTKDRDRLLDVMCEIAGSKSLTATPTQFYQHLQRIASDATITNPEALTATEPKEQWK